MDKKLIGGIFDNVSNAEKAINELQEQGYGKEDISVFAREDEQAEALQEHTDTEVKDDDGSNTGKGLGIGALSGGVLGGIAGLIAEAALVAIPGVGPLIAAGPVATALAGLGTGAVSGGIVGALVGAGIPEEQAEEYEKYLKDNKIIVMVEADPEKEARIYETFRAYDTLNATMYPKNR